MTKTTETKKIKIAPTNANIVKITVQQVGDGCVWGGASINTWWCEYWWCKYWWCKYGCCKYQWCKYQWCKYWCGEY